ncbi:MAG: Gfo/Idh/MocA family oxidoreductase [Proteobacteria bacterium]|uniref:Gfo/Idh/MocA family oxidoreductase n=1 Tax=Candidatus Avisuccinivibrio stercorigallinarum TaxID=2840704 RepID=A0A9D9DCZ0_9GAMM|nr:Gfo/Idh/MocA family oxidoreductase [Candidatus Avisuccinivibrio stercorigallinarum]
MKVGILGAGRIAAVMAETINRMNPRTEVFLHAIGSRSLERAQAFAAEHHVPKAYGSYEEMLKDPEVDLVYIATPHSEHYANIKACIAAGKGMLVEKSFTANAAQAHEVIKEAEEKGVFITEAIWTRYMPSRKVIADAITFGGIGEVHAIQANLSYPISNKPRITDPALAGGALLDLGVYTLNFAMMFLGHWVTEVSSSCIKGPTGVDLIDNIALTFKGGKCASLMANACCPSDRMGYIYGEKGYIAVTNINNPEKVELFNADHQLVKTYKIPPQITGYEYQLISCRNALERHELSCIEMSHQETIDIMELMDELRKDWEVTFPFEEEVYE